MQEMDFVESAMIVFHRMRELEPENVSKIIGFLLLQDGGDRRINELASSSNTEFLDLVFSIKAELGLAMNRGGISPPTNSAFISELSSHFNIPVLPPVPSNYCNHQDYYCSEGEFGNLVPRTRNWYPTVFEFPVKTCHYFNKGFCKHGSSCRYFHGQVSEVFPEVLNHHYSDSSMIDDHIFSPASLKKLELEIVELLRSRNGAPVSIASLPMLYFEKYGKVLRADGYLTESQRHGKAGYSLTKLLARLKESIRLIDRPHGQHAVILSEDASKYMGNRNERNDPGPIVNGSRQIYLTFPEESTFTEDDVSNYFSSFGAVVDVRIPCQQKRMFGFVTFDNAEAVMNVFAKGNPHFVCGARVLVKPYREKSKLVDRKYQDRIDSPVYGPPRRANTDSKFYSMGRGDEVTRLYRNHLIEEQERALEIETRRMAELQMTMKYMENQRHYNYTTPDHMSMPLVEHFGYRDTANDANINHLDTDQTDRDSSNQGLNLPDSPFAAPFSSAISALI